MIERHIQNIETELQAIRNHLAGFNLSAVREGDRIRIEWTGEINEIQWELNGKTVSLNDMWKNTDLDPPEIEGNVYYIGTSDTVDKITEVTVGTGAMAYDSNDYNFWKKQTVSVTHPQTDPVETYPLLVTLWDSWKNDYKDFDNVKIGKWDDIRTQYDKGKTVIISASHTWKEEVDGKTVLEPEYKWERRLKRLRDIVKDLDTNRYLIFLQDEPFGKSHWTLSDLNRLIALSKGILPEGARLGMSFTNGSVNKRELPQGLNFYVTPNYPFKTEWAVEEGHKSVSTKQDYDQDFDELISRYRAKIGDKEIYVIGQGFYNTGSGSVKPHEKRWAKPPIEYPEWLYEACWRNNLPGVWWWLYEIKRSHYKALSDMPEFFEEVKALNKEMAEN